jgi:hypothetical protein
MKVKIGNYPNRLMCKLHSNYMNKKYGYVDWPTEHTRFELCLEWLDDRVQDFYNVFNWLWFDRREQKIKVRIDPWDTWSIDHTLAHIVLPMLIQLKETKHGGPYVDLKDVPKELHGKKLTKKQKDNGEIDDKHFERWDWVLDEMIFAFASKLEDWEDQFYSGKHDVYFKELDDGSGMSELKRGPNDTFEVDREGMRAYQDRISNGFRLFGKYYETLWD